MLFGNNEKKKKKKVGFEYVNTYNSNYANFVFSDWL